MLNSRVSTGRRTTGILLWAFAIALGMLGCASSVNDAIHTDPVEQRAYQRISEAPTVDAFESYIGNHPRGAHIQDVYQLYKEYRDKRFRDATQIDNVQVWKALLHDFPQSGHEIRGPLERAQQREWKAAPETARTAQLLIDYRERGTSDEAPPQLVNDLREILRFAGLRLVVDEPADFVVTVRGYVTFSDANFSGGTVLIDSNVGFEGEIDFRHSSGLGYSESLRASESYAPGQISRMEGTEPYTSTPSGWESDVRVSQTLASADCQKALIHIIRKVYGNELIAKGITSDSNAVVGAAFRELKSHAYYVGKYVEPYLTHPEPRVRDNATSVLKTADLNIRMKEISRSIGNTPEACACPYHVNREDGRPCEDRSVYSQTNGKKPFCYESDVPDELVEQIRQSL